MRRRLALGIAAAGLLFGGFALHDRTSPRTATSERGTPSSSVSWQPSAKELPAVSAPAVAHDDRTIDDGAVPPMATTADLDRYLDGLEARVKSGADTGDELALALAAAKKGDATIGKDRSRMKLATFGQRIHLIKRDRAVAAKMAQIASIAEKLKEQKDPAERARLTREYSAATADLPPNARAEAAAQLERLRGS